MERRKFIKTIGSTFFYLMTPFHLSKQKTPKEKLRPLEHNLHETNRENLQRIAEVLQGGHRIEESDRLSLVFRNKVIEDKKEGLMSLNVIAFPMNRESVGGLYLHLPAKGFNINKDYNKAMSHFLYIYPYRYLTFCVSGYDGPPSYLTKGLKESGLDGIVDGQLGGVVDFEGIEINPKSTILKFFYDVLSRHRYEAIEDPEREAANSLYGKILKRSRNLLETHSMYSI